MPYISSLPKLETTLKEKHILLDSDFFISILAFKVEEILAHLIRLKTGLSIIQPIQIELMRTDKVSNRAQRLRLIEDYHIDTLPLQYAFQHAADVQSYLYNKGIYPSPIDIYLGAMLAHFNQENILLCTGNISHFPEPLYRRETCIILQNSTNSKNLWFLSLNRSELNSVVPF